MDDQLGKRMKNVCRFTSQVKKEEAGLQKRLRGLNADQGRLLVSDIAEIESSILEKKSWIKKEREEISLILSGKGAEDGADKKEESVEDSDSDSTDDDYDVYGGDGGYENYDHHVPEETNMYFEIAIVQKVEEAATKTSKAGGGLKTKAYREDEDSSGDKSPNPVGKLAGEISGSSLSNKDEKPAVPTGKSASKSKELKDPVEETPNTNTERKRSLGQERVCYDDGDQKLLNLKKQKWSLKHE